MISNLLSFGLDITILLALGITIFFAIRLSGSINKLREGRSEFLQLMEELGKNIIAAEDATTQLKQASLATGEQLRRKVREGQHLHDELEIMIENAGNIADRLEKSTEGTGTSAKNAQKKTPEQTVTKPRKTHDDNDWVMSDADPAQISKDQDDDDLPSFFIQDTDHEPPAAPAKESGHSKPNEDQGRSKAEQELYEALQKNKKGRKAS